MNICSVNSYQAKKMKPTIARLGSFTCTDKRFIGIQWFVFYWQVNPHNVLEKVNETDDFKQVNKEKYTKIKYKTWQQGNITSTRVCKVFFILFYFLFSIFYFKLNPCWGHRLSPLHLFIAACQAGRQWVPFLVFWYDSNPTFPDYRAGTLQLGRLHVFHILA